MGKLIDYAIILAIVVGVIAAAVFVYLLRRPSKTPRTERDQSMIPSHWFSYSRAIHEGHATEIGIQRVSDKDKIVLERRSRLVLQNDDPDYDEKFDAEMEEAYHASIKADQFNYRR